MDSDFSLDLFQDEVRFLTRDMSTLSSYVCEHNAFRLLTVLGVTALKGRKVPTSLNCVSGTEEYLIQLGLLYLGDMSPPIRRHLLTRWLRDGLADLERSLAGKGIHYHQERSAVDDDRSELARHGWLEVPYWNFQ